MNMDIPEVQSPQNPSTVVNNYITKAPKAHKGGTSESGKKFMNVVILVIVSVLFIGILATYFVRDLPDFVIGLRELTKQALWVILGGYSIGELLKIFFINRARASKEYQDAKSDAEKELAKIVAQPNNRVKEYCKKRTDEIFENNQAVMLAGSKISLELFKERYQALSTKEILIRFPEDNLSKKQLLAIKRANAVKKEQYNPNFLVSTLHENVQRVPSERYNAERRNIKNSIMSMFFSVIAGIFGVGLANGIVFDFSAAVVLAAIIKIILLLFTISLRLIFANSLVFNTEIGRFRLQELESKSYLSWYEENPVEVIKDEERKEEPYGQIVYEEQGVPALPVEAAER